MQTSARCAGLLPAGAQQGEQIVEAAGVGAADGAGARHQAESWVIPICDSALGRVVGVLEEFREGEETQIGVGALSGRPVRVLGNDEPG